VQLTATKARRVNASNGHEEYVESGWLRLSDRRLDRRLSSELDPVPTYRQSDVEPLTPVRPVYARIQFLPFDPVFRAGSAVPPHY
jgi:hypothetical protein